MGWSLVQGGVRGVVTGDWGAGRPVLMVRGACGAAGLVAFLGRRSAVREGVRDGVIVRAKAGLPRPCVPNLETGSGVFRRPKPRRLKRPMLPGPGGPVRSDEATARLSLAPEVDGSRGPRRSARVTNMGWRERTRRSEVGV